MGSFRGRPSKSHIIWTRKTRKGATKKRFDNEWFKKWSHHYNFDFETSKRVDHDRAEEPRMQFRCVFAWGQMDGESFTFGDQEWELASQKTPRTFVEIDEAGYARIKDWQTESVHNVVELRYDGPKLKLKTAADETRVIDGRKLASKPETCDS